METGTRDELIGSVAGAVQAIRASHPVRVAVDGAPASGKTTLADELAAVLRNRGRHVVRATIDDFLAPREQRYRRGEFSAEGCYLDAHDLEAVNRVLVDPVAPTGCVLVFDGVFLMRPELVDRWDLRILVSVEPDEAVRRAVLRDGRSSSPPEVERRWRERYLPAQRLYDAVAQPADLADFVVHNDEPLRPSWRDQRESSSAR